MQQYILSLWWVGGVSKSRRLALRTNALPSELPTHMEANPGFEPRTQGFAGLRLCHLTSSPYKIHWAGRAPSHPPQFLDTANLRPLLFHNSYFALYNTQCINGAVPGTRTLNLRFVRPARSPVAPAPHKSFPRHTSIGATFKEYSYPCPSPPAVD